MTIREMEAAWIGTKEPVPRVVKAVWFLSAVIVGWRKFYSPALRKATSATGNRDDVLEALTVLVGIGKTAEAVREEVIAET